MSSAWVGDLRHRLSIETADDQPDGLGGQSRAWLPWSRMWARVEPLDLATDPESGRFLRRYRATVRYRPDFPKTARAIWNDTPHFIRAVSDPDVRGERLHLILEES